MQVKNNNIAFLVLLSIILLVTIICLMLVVMLLHRSVKSYIQKNRVLHKLEQFILGVAITISIITGLVYIVGIYYLCRRVRHKNSFGKVNGKEYKTPYRFFIIRMIFFSISTISAWFVYSAAKKGSFKILLRWAFFLENTLLLILIFTALALYTQVKYIRTL